MIRKRKVSLAIVAVLLCACASATDAPPPTAHAPAGAVTVVNTDATDLDLVTGQVVYVPAYSEIYTRGDGQTIDLAITLSVRNTDLEHPILVTVIRYYDTNGNLVKDYLERPVQLGPLASSHVIIDPTDDTGGVGANFIVEWGAEATVHEPVIEAVMINTASQQGLSLISPGRVISQTN